MLSILKYNDVNISNNIEFARTIFTQITGLMFRNAILPGYSMIFILKKPCRVDVHTLCVFFPIDVIFLNVEKKVTGLSRLKPLVGYKAMENVKYIIEMKAGTIDVFSICVGGQMEFEENI